MPDHDLLPLALRFCASEVEYYADEKVVGDSGAYNFHNSLLIRLIFLMVLLIDLLVLNSGGNLILKFEVSFQFFNIFS